MKNKNLIFLVLGIILINFVSAICTVTFNKAVYDQKGTVSATML